MKVPEDSLRGRIVLSSDGLVVGEVARLFVDPATWRVRSLEVKLRKDAADRAGVSRSLFHAATLEISTELVQSTGDAVILSVAAGALRSAAPAEQPAPPPTPPAPR